jgi:hypothetical protein
MDIFVGEMNHGYRVLLNDGYGKYTEHSAIEDARAIWPIIALGDVDNDGDLDAMVTNGSRQKANPAQVFLNDGKGRFTDSGQRLCSAKMGRIGLGDINNDGFIDAVITDFMQPSQLWINDGKGRFFDSGMRFSQNPFFTGVTIKDVDDDGDKDVFFANFRNGPNELWFNSFEK